MSKIFRFNENVSCNSFVFSGIEPIELDGHFTLNSTAACIHRRSNFYACIVGMGKNRRGLEIYGKIQ